jgi:membrane-bound metal-dependent hydrolase YbcI (DUF457 family)
MPGSAAGAADVCMAKTHALSGVTVWLAATPLLGLGGREIAAGVVVTAGAAMLPDLDHPSSSIARSWGPLTRALARLTARVSGGHRQGTHSLLFIALVGLAGAAAGAAGGWWAVVPVFLAASLALGVLLADKGLRNEALAAGLALAVWAGEVETGWLGWALALGSLAHLLGDALTPERVPLLWPHRRRYGVGLFTTDTWPERVLAGLLAAANVVLAVQVADAWPEAEMLARAVTGVGA